MTNLDVVYKTKWDVWDVVVLVSPVDTANVYVYQFQQCQCLVLLLLLLLLLAVLTHNRQIGRR